MSTKELTKERAKPELVKVGTKTFLVGGRWNHDRMADHITERGQDKWVPVAELAKVGCGANTSDNRRRVRARLSPLCRTLRGRGLLLAIEYGGQYHSATAVKIADLNLEQDRQNVMVRLQMQRRRKEVSEEEYARWLALIEAADKPS
jgi:hypothetical protein